MGFLAQGRALHWDEAKPYIDYVREHGVEQFLHIFRTYENRHRYALMWGDEVEYSLVKWDHEHRRVRLSLRADEILAVLNAQEAETARRKAAGEEGVAEELALWRPEYGRWMVEGTPGGPFRDISDFVNIERSMRQRRAIVEGMLHEGESIMSISNFPMFGATSDDYTVPAVARGGPITNSAYTGDGVIFPHARFQRLTENIRTRRGSNVDIRVPIFRDAHTAADVHEIHMDAMAFGMGCCCLQTTFQACNIFESRHLYDQLAVLAPVMLALSAATPIFRGQLADIDVRWNVIAAAVDDRTPFERGESDEGVGTRRIPTSRYDSIDNFISADVSFRDEYNDVPVVVDEAILAKLVASGIDERLAKHVAHLFIRDPLVIYSNRIELDDTKDADHFENFQSTNWQNVRWKPPPPDSPIGWRVEFRTMEAQLTDFENAAYVTFIVLMTRVILSFDLNFYVPMSKVHENMQRAHKRDAVGMQKFFFRKSVTKHEPQRRCECEAGTVIPPPPSTPPPQAAPGATPASPLGEYYEEMTIDQIMHGKGDYPGLVPLLELYLNHVGVDAETRMVIDQYIALISKRASGELLTTASYVRKFVRAHASYAADSCINEEIQYDLLRHMHDIQTGATTAPELTGDLLLPSEGASA